MNVFSPSKSIRQFFVFLPSFFSVTSVIVVMKSSDDKALFLANGLSAS